MQLPVEERVSKITWKSWSISSIKGAKQLSLLVEWNPIKIYQVAGLASPYNLVMYCCVPCPFGFKRVSVASAFVRQPINNSSALGFWYIKCVMNTSCVLLVVYNKLQIMILWSKQNLGTNILYDDVRTSQMNLKRLKLWSLLKAFTTAK